MNIVACLTKKRNGNGISHLHMVPLLSSLVAPEKRRPNCGKVLLGPVTFVTLVTLPPPLGICTVQRWVLKLWCVHFAHLWGAEFSWSCCKSAMILCDILFRAARGHPSRTLLFNVNILYAHPKCTLPPASSTACLTNRGYGIYIYICILCIFCSTRWKRMNQVKWEGWPCRSVWWIIPIWDGLFQTRLHQASKK